MECLHISYKRETYIHEKVCLNDNYFIHHFIRFAVILYDVLPQTLSQNNQVTNSCLSKRIMS